ncbi:cytospin-A isoform X1 [Scleropages formosus]|uniref:Cytospin-A n=1 Tax=Scleropages formosus TaxID=113540 RepID=A0A8C9VUN7_SCLFO|nr:cytospin-A-like isoform X1 [Scleropages formosus]XP_029114467.1 cytospin-A-like isoform X1 [Scleropages formosus]XP_029114468.1 cytospin-A-like isoform X1 [Scleropages formosus]
MGNYASKDGHTPAAGTHTDKFHTPPSSPVGPSVPGTCQVSASTQGHQDGVPPGDARVGRRDGTILSRKPSQTKVQESILTGSTGKESDSRGPPESGGTNLDRTSKIPIVQETCSPPTCPSERTWLEKDSGLDQSLVEVSTAGQEPIDEEALPSLETLLEAYRATLALSSEHDGPWSPADLVRRLLEEREKLAAEVQGLQAVMKAERDEWLQFQSDLQVAVAVADRLRVEAEEELSALREAHRDAEQRLAAALQRQEETDGELEALRTRLQEACRKLCSLEEEEQQRRDSSRVSDEAGATKRSGDTGAHATGGGHGGRERCEGTDRGRVPVKRSRGEEPIAKERAREGRGVAEGYLRSVAAEEKKKEDSWAGRELRKVPTVSERSRSLSRLPVSSDAPLAVNGTSQLPAPATGSLVKKQQTGKQRQVDATLEQRDSRSGTGRQEEIGAPPPQGTSTTDTPPTISGKIWPQDGFSRLLRRHGGSKRNSLLRWCQSRTQGYKNIDITNFSSSWADGLAFCAVYHTYLPSHIPFSSLSPERKRENLELSFRTGESVGIPASLTVEEMLKADGPDWQRVLGYVESIYRHFEM